MDNVKLGKIGSLVTGASVLAFAFSMIFGIFTDTLFLSCLFSIFIAVGFVIFVSALCGVSENGNNKAFSYAALIFAAVYAALVLIVYFAECTYIRLNGGLPDEVLSVISYSYQGSLFFSYDLLGYAFMAISTFLTGCIIIPKNQAGKWLKILLTVHGVFFICCLFMPMFPLFTSGTNPIVGTIVLEVWCAYFLPVCVLGYRYFDAKNKTESTNIN